jgi:glycosyltransferase involved in cell wall biosynthesis
VRIAYVSGDLGVPVFGRKGASVHVRELTRALRALGHEVLVLTPRADGERPQGFDVPVVEFAPDPGDREAQRRRHADELCERALPLLQEVAPDAIYERSSLFGTAGLQLARALGVPHLLEVNAPLADEHARYRGRDGAEEARRIERDLVRATDRVIAVSRGVARWLWHVGVDPERIMVLPNGVDADRFRPADGAAVRAALGLDGHVVGFVGTLKPWHDVATLIAAVAALPARPQLLLVGDGPERARLAEQARAAGVQAVLTGAIDHDDVPAHLAAVDVAVAPYAPDDGFYFSPLKLVEYLAAARPVAAADVGDIRHCVRPGETGYLYPPGDAPALAAAIDELLADREAAGRLGAAGREHVRAEHTWTATARTVVELAGEAAA